MRAIREIAADIGPDEAAKYADEVAVGREHFEAAESTLDSQQ
jgi:hypothetical protein